MLYLSTRDDRNTYTSHISLTRDTADDGGLFIPFHIPFFSKEDMLALKDRTFNQNMAFILNMFFSARLTGWDMDLILGKNGCKVLSMNHKIVLSELWHNPDMNFSRATESLCCRLAAGKRSSGASVWFRIAVRVAVLFSIYGHMIREGIWQYGVDFDVVIPADDMSWPVAAILARIMGLNYGKAIIACSEENNIWDLVHRGIFATTSVCADVQRGVEAMIRLAIGGREAARFAQCCDSHKGFSFSEENPFAEDYYCTVAGKNRCAIAINSLFRSNGYLIDPGCALCFSGLQDYRSGTGAGRVALLISEQSPLNYGKEILAATGISEQQLNQLVKL